MILKKSKWIFVLLSVLQICLMYIYPISPKSAELEELRNKAIKEPTKYNELAYLKAFPKTFYEFRFIFYGPKNSLDELYPKHQSHMSLLWNLSKKYPDMAKSIWLGIAGGAPPYTASRYADAFGILQTQLTEYGGDNTKEFAFALNKLPKPNRLKVIQFMADVENFIYYDEYKKLLDNLKYLKFENLYIEFEAAKKERMKKRWDVQPLNIYPISAKSAELEELRNKLIKEPSEYNELAYLKAFPKTFNEYHFIFYGKDDNFEELYEVGPFYLNLLGNLFKKYPDKVRSIWFSIVGDAQPYKPSPIAVDDAFGILQHQITEYIKTNTKEFAIELNKLPKANRIKAIQFMAFVDDPDFDNLLDTLKNNKFEDLYLELKNAKLELIKKRWDKQYHQPNTMIEPYNCTF